MICSTSGFLTDPTHAHRISCLGVLATYKWLPSVSEMSTPPAPHQHYRTRIDEEDKVPVLEERCHGQVCLLCTVGLHLPLVLLLGGLVDFLETLTLICRDRF